jgi:rare lipoprotein A
MLLLAGTFLDAKAELGIASVYSDAFNASATASGELYDKSKYTAAHKTLDFGTLVRVTRLDNNRSVIVRVNDRGPYLKGYVIVISGVAAAKLGIATDAQANVKLEVVGKKEEISELKKKDPPYSPPTPSNDELVEKGGDNDQSPTRPPVEYDVVKTTDKHERSSADIGTVSDAPAKRTERRARPKTTDKAEKAEPPTETKKAEAVKKTSPVKELATIRKVGFHRHDLYKPVLQTTDKLRFGVKVGAFEHFENVLKQAALLQENWFSNVYLILDEKGSQTELYKLILESFDDKDAAYAYAARVRKKGLSAYVIDYTDFDKNNVFAFRALRPEKTGFAVQVGLFSNKDIVLDKISALQAKWFNNILISVERDEKGETIYRFLLGPFPDLPTATSYKTHLKEKGMDSFTVDLSGLKY